MGHLIDFVLEQGADCLMPTALTGEGPLLTEAETVAVWDAVFEKTAGKIPVIPAVISTTTQRAVRLAREAQQRGAAALMVAPILPELYAGRSAADVFAFYSEVAAASSLAIILFNYPSLTGVDFVPSLVACLAEIENIQYIKESSGDVRRVHGIQRLLGNRVEVICGAPNLALESLALGCRAWITGIMNVAPRSARQLMEAVGLLGDLTLARRIYYTQLLPLVDILACNFNPTGTIKAGVCAREVNVGVPRRPGSAVGPQERGKIERLVGEIEKAEQAVAHEIALRKA
jgi:4-hydroxy-tetrahydrodipicolinate synthase